MSRDVTPVWPGTDRAAFLRVTLSKHEPRMQKKKHKAVRAACQGPRGRHGWKKRSTPRPRMDSPSFKPLDREILRPQPWELLANETWRPFPRLTPVALSSERICFHGCRYCEGIPGGIETSSESCPYRTAEGGENASGVTPVEIDRKVEKRGVEAEEDPRRMEGSSLLPLISP